jgi:hypothetical protein
MAHPVFITYKFEDRLYVCQCQWPHYQARVEHQPNHKYWTIQIAGYELHLNFAGTLAGNFLPMDMKAGSDIPKVMEQMGIFYLIERVEINQKRYAKFKIQTKAS